MGIAQTRPWANPSWELEEVYNLGSWRAPVVNTTWAPEVMGFVREMPLKFQGHPREGWCKMISWPDFDGMDWTYPKELVPLSSVGVNPIKSIGVTYVECFACVHRFFRLGQCFLIVMRLSFSQFFFCCCCCCFWVSLRSWTRGLGKIKHAHVPIFRVICDLPSTKNHRSIGAKMCVKSDTNFEGSKGPGFFPGTWAWCVCPSPTRSTGRWEDFLRSQIWSFQVWQTFF